MVRRAATEILTDPLPPIAIPNLTDTPGHWAAPVQILLREGSELEFWVHLVTPYMSHATTTAAFKLLTGVDLREPL
ncbi:E3 ubiquitin-protein ligase NEURL3 [Lates japonicus]|uniref:E3 ubiquitin-protein ligase NEURL3 n=1 Tax=Lates japonicus TaxID=270547 RepID=A0AAD3NMU1_LATJO|nr:E3 ubiquitin-protein ligase NEURL3 [Lates japonicus]